MKNRISPFDKSDLIDEIWSPKIFMMKIWASWTIFQEKKKFVETIFFVNKFDFLSGKYLNEWWIWFFNQWRKFFVRSIWKKFCQINNFSKTVNEEFWRLRILFCKRNLWKFFIEEILFTDPECQNLIFKLFPLFEDWKTIFKKTKYRSLLIINKNFFYVWGFTRSSCINII